MADGTAAPQDGAPLSRNVLVHEPTGWFVDPVSGIVYSGRPIGYSNSYGYLRSSNAEGERYLHRVVWEACVGPIEDGHQVNHINGDKRDNRLVNLEAVTVSANILHSYATGLRGRRSGAVGRCGEEHSQRKLDEAAVRDIRATKGRVTNREAAARYGVSPVTVSRVRRGISWLSVEDEAG